MHLPSLKTSIVNFCFNLKKWYKPLNFGNKYMSNKKFVLIVTGIGDALCSNNSKKKIRKNDELVDKVNKTLEHLTQSTSGYSLVNFHYPSDTMKDVNVFEPYPQTKVVDIKIHSPNLIEKDNELSIIDHDGKELLFNGDQFDFIFRPEEYDVYICGIDLYGILKKTIEDLLEKGYKVTVFSNALNAMQTTYKYINSLQRNKNFDFCSYKSV